MKKNLLVLSYYANMPGACQAEWVDDRINAFIEQDYNITLISSIGTFKNNSIIHKRVPTLSPHGFINEYNEILNRKIIYSKFYKFLIKIYYFISIYLFKILSILGLKSGEGRWTWTLTSLFITLFSSKKYDFIYSTGGPASPHITGIILSKIYNKKIIAELQDPLSGKDIGRNKYSRIGLKIIEKFIIKNATISLYCTKNAMIDAREKYKKYSNKINYVYPGSAVKYDKDNHVRLKKEKINITYLGSLYQTRNLDSLMSAIRLLATEIGDIENLIEINLYGNINVDIKKRILDFEYNIIQIHGLISREQAMLKAGISDILLLIQNTDDRSITTIPFKTYDYLHTGKLIFGLIYKNDELADLLTSHGHLACQADNINQIKNDLKRIIEKIKDGENNIKTSNFTPRLAAIRMIDLINECNFEKI